MTLRENIGSQKKKMKHYSSNQVKTFILAYDYEYTEDSFVLFKKHDDGGNRLGSVSFTEIAQEDFNTLTKI